jgi:hypothetical protein
MIPAAFDYERVDSVEAAIAALPTTARSCWRAGTRSCRR